MMRRTLPWHGLEICRWRVKSPSSWASNDRILLTLYLLGTLWFVGVTSLGPHRAWATLALPAYAVGVILSVPAGSRRFAPLVAAVGSVLIPLTWLILTQESQPEVAAVADGARDWLTARTPYLEDPQDLSQFRPYFPLTFLFGMPSSVFGLGGVGDPRIWLDLTLVGWLWPLYRGAGSDGRVKAATLRSTWLLLSCPLVALELSVSSIDVPTIGLIALAAYAYGRGHPSAAVALACVSTLIKPTAIVVVLLISLVSLRVGGRRVGRRIGLAMLAMGASGIALVMLSGLDRFLVNAILFPADLATVPTPAKSPFPGVLIAAHLPHGHTIAIGVTAAYVAACLVFGFRRVDPSARGILQAGAVALVGIYLLAPASRAGYLIVPLLLWWLARNCGERPVACPRGSSRATSP